MTPPLLLLLFAEAEAAAAAAMATAAFAAESAAETQPEENIDWCHLVDRHRPTAWDTTRKLVVPQAVGADQPNDTSLQHLGFTWLRSLVAYSGGG
ncbi:hypothetical protein TYRP_012231 [Tyrophagus putrescentiae]|nr:hypothetical protein TYRP_012231 [Tyrophagus putrescentiae]